MYFKKCNLCFISKLFLEGTRLARKEWVSGKAVFSFASLWGRLGRSCDGGLESLPFTTGFLWKAFPWPLFSRKRRVANRNITRFHWWNVAPTKPCTMTTSGWKNFPQIWTGYPPSKLLHCMPKGYLWGTRRGSVFENITGTCIQHLKVFDPFMNCWQLFCHWSLCESCQPSKRRKQGQSAWPKKPQELVRSQDVRQPERGNNPEFQEKLRHLY